MDKRWPNSLLDSPTNLVLHPNGAVVPSEDAAILTARAHNLAAQAAHIDLLAKNGLYVPFGYPATTASLGSQSDLNLLSSPYSAAAANEVAALQAARAHLATTEAALQAARVNLAAKEAANMKASAAVKATLLSSNGLYTPGYSTDPTTVGSPLGLNLVTYPNGAIVPTEGADILAARASHKAAHDATTSGSLKADHSGVHPVADADHSVGHDDHSSQIRHDSIKLVSHPGGAVVPAEGFALATARAKHLAAHKAASAEGTLIEADQTNDLSTEGAQQ